MVNGLVKIMPFSTIEDLTHIFVIPPLNARWIEKLSLPGDNTFASPSLEERVKRSVKLKVSHWCIKAAWAKHGDKVKDIVKKKKPFRP